MSSWGWKPERTVGLWRYGANWMKPLVAATPFLTIIVLLLMLFFVSGTLTRAQGVLFDLPDSQFADGEMTDLVALVMPMPHETLIFFDDSRYLLGDAASMRAMDDHLSQRLSRSKQKTILVLADRRVSGGDLMKLAACAKRNGAQRILFAEKKADRAE